MFFISYDIMLILQDMKSAWDSKGALFDFECLDINVNIKLCAVKS